MFVLSIATFTFTFTGQELAEKGVYLPANKNVDVT